MISCFVIPHFATAIERKLNGELCSQPVLIASSHVRSWVVAMSREAQQAGVEIEITIRQAQLLCPEALVIPANHLAYQRQVFELAEHLLQFSHKVEPEYQPTTTAFYLDTTDELEQIEKAIHEFLGVKPSVGIATNKFTARVAGAYAYFPEPHIIQVGDGKEAQFLSQYPVKLLPLTKDMKRRLPFLGIKTIGQYAHLPRSGVFEQFGKRSLWIHDLAKGVDIRPIASYKPPEIIRTQRLFETPLDNYFDILHFLKSLGRQAITKLDNRQAEQVVLMIELENRQVLEHHFQPPDPIIKLKPLLRHLETLLYRQPISSGVAVLTVQLNQIQDRLPKQLSLFTDTKEVIDLNTHIPRWQQRHWETEFLEIEMQPIPAFYLFERACTYQEVGL